MSEPTGAASQIVAWEQDPGAKETPDGGTLIARPIPVLNHGPFQSVIQGDKVPVDQYPVGTAGFRHWAAADSLGRASALWGQFLPKTKWHPTVGHELQVLLDAGEDLNAFYDRSSLQFFHGFVAGRTVYSAESPDIVCHEFGHAVLDAIRPQFWDTAALEIGAFHEAFGDISAILCALQLQSVRQAVLAETGGVLYRSSRLSRLAEQLGWAIRQEAPSAVERDCLRNAVNRFFYADPDGLPTLAPANQLSSEVHSFSRLFSGAFFETLASIFAIQACRTEQDLQNVSLELARMLIQAIRQTPVSTNYYSQLGAHLVQVAHATQESHAAVIQGALVQRGILSPKGVAQVAAQPRAAAAVVAAEPETQQPPMRELDGPQFGLGVAKIQVQVAGSPKRFGVAGAAPAIGDLSSRSAEDSAAAFVEDLIRRGRLDPQSHAHARFALVRPSGFKTHELVEENGGVVLRRRRIDCGFHLNASSASRR